MMKVWALRIVDLLEQCLQRVLVTQWQTDHEVQLVIGFQLTDSRCLAITDDVGNVLGMKGMLLSLKRSAKGKGHKGGGEGGCLHRKRKTLH